MQLTSTKYAESPKLNLFKQNLEISAIGQNAVLSFQFLHHHVFLPNGTRYVYVGIENVARVLIVKT